MRKKITIFSGILGLSLFILSSVIGGALIENYSITSQFISESYAIDTEYGLSLRLFFIIPSGLLLTVFFILGHDYFKSSNLTRIGFFGLAIFYGLATVLVGIFPCDSGCNKELINPSHAQIIHNLVGLLTYVFVPISIIIIGTGLRGLSPYESFSKKSFLYGILSIAFIFILFSNSNSEYLGLYQRMVELTFVVWIITCLHELNKQSSKH